ncbi:MAG: hypothetical protein GWO11_06835, partial [Desulfuromonadales bacterium]|nr:hypothetical protein [Desulfuromonadales bacterium]NIR34062.1 hypothetical protein [Desulfuromonadales bacterium]NIS44113.1 hypothetical protein [Desulfuromonadales bacterium]
MSRLGEARLLDGDGLPLCSLQDVNSLETAQKDRIYGRVVPPRLFEIFDIDPASFRGVDGQRKVRFTAPEGLGLVRIDVRLSRDARDSVFFVELADTPYRQLELSFCIINDPVAPRFNIDRDSAGRDNHFGTVRRNLEEELRAMEAGLSPHQVRHGLGLFSEFYGLLEMFADRLGIDTIVAEALSYCNAVRYERYGFDYITGKQKMLWIDREFSPGGDLYRRLDGSTPFRRPGMEKTVKGRSWAIHDGILGEPWDGVHIYKPLGVDAGVSTFRD